MDAANTAEELETRSQDSETGAPESRGEEPMLVEELLVEEVSIDGMCGVY